MARYLFTIFDGANVCYAWDEVASDHARAKQLADEIASDLVDDGGLHHGLSIVVGDADGNTVARVKVDGRKHRQSA